MAAGRSDSARKGLAVGEGKSRWLKRGCSAEVAGLKGLPSGALPSSIPARTEARVLGQLRNSQGGCCCGPSGCRGRVFPGPRTPRGPIPRLCPAAPRALPAAWRWQCSPRPSRATGHPLRDRGDHRPGPALVTDQHSFRARGPRRLPHPPDPGEMPVVPSTASSTISSSLSMAAATLPSTGQCGRFPSLRVLAAAERALGLSPASLEEEEGEEEEEQSRRFALPPPTVLSIPRPAAAVAAAVPPPFVPGPQGSGVQRPLQLSPVIPPLCCGAADPLTSPGAGALPPSLIDSSLSFPRSEDP